jgi:two-component system, NtrC family, sensor histidine kinase KinB
MTDDIKDKDTANEDIFAEGIEFGKRSLREELLLPLTSVHMAIHVCLEKSLGDLTPKQEEFLSVARSECYHIRKILTNIGIVEKFENMKTKELKEKISFPSILKECVKSMEIISSVKNIKIKMDFPLSLEDIYANKNQIALVINNLIDNAVYHSLPNGVITIRVKSKDDGYVSFLIHNYGSYIAKQYLEKYFQIPNEQSKRDGLGLYIAKRIIEEEHRGEIKVLRSSEKLGTTFYFKIPIILL